MSNVADANDRWLAEHERDVRASIENITRLRAELAYLQVGWRPPTGGWSIGQVFEHLILTDTPYLEEMQRALQQGARAGGRAWKPSFMGGLISRAVSPATKRKSKAFANFQPGPEPRAYVIDEYLARRTQLVELIDHARGVDLNSVRMRSPIIRLARLNLGDAIEIMTLHTQRHLQQVERIKNHPDFPQSGA